MTGDEVFKAALARCAEFNVNVPSTQSVALHRINARQQQLFVRIADASPEYFGTQQVCPLVANEIDLATLSPNYERITYIQMSDPGSSNYVYGDTVNVVTVMDKHAGLPPRVFLRDAKLVGVEQDLAGVVELEVFYSKRPTTVNAGTVVIELPEQFQELLVIDLARHLLRKMVELSQDARTVALDSLDTEENELLADLDRHLEQWRHAETARGPHSYKPQPRPTR